MICQLSGRVLSLATAILLAVCLSTPLFGTRVCCEGEQWLRWTNDVRQTYVLAFSLGYSKGYVQGCDVGTRDVTAGSKPGLENDPTRNCRQKGLDFSRGTDYFVKSITDFYTRFPSDRDIYVEELIQCFARGLSVEEAHRQHFPSRDKPQPKP
jgi:hypothetical protein